MDCKTARLLLDFARPLCPELDTADAEALHNHLAECPECGPFAAGERRVDEQIGRAVRDVPVPEEFKQRLLNRLSQERDNWYRRWIVRGGAAAAAAVLLCLGLSWYFWRAPDLDLREIQQQAQASEKVPADEARVADWFRRNGGYQVKLPSDFKYALLADYGFATFRGRTVPRLLFVQSNKLKSGPDYAEVFVLSDEQFNLATLESQPDREESGMPRVRVLRLAGDPHVVFIAVYNTNSLDVFLNQGPQG
jgi:hypothetical protein